MHIWVRCTMLAGLALMTPAHAEPPPGTFTSGQNPAQASQPPSPVIMLGEPTLDQARVARAQANLLALRDGRISVSQLSPDELQDVIELDRLVRGGATFDNRTFAQQCVDEEVRRAGGQPTRLAWAVIKLKCQ
ncbi:MAG TPA: hypothetical protein VLA50_01450 [Erythrobacter sp.]|nr:hypothetical protein [Erythrobacter sp.]